MKGQRRSPKSTSGWLALGVLSWGGLVAGLASAAEPQPGGSDSLRIWYRTSEGCPDGSVFVARLAALGRNASLAAVGDRVDFVVTLAASNGQSSGRLERQTVAGTVAIRELSAAGCDDVAEGLVLSLDLALEPGAQAVGVAAPQPSEPVSRSAVLSDVGSSGAGDGVMLDERPGEVAAPPGAGGFALGGQASLESGISPGVLPGVSLFGQFAPAPAWYGRLSLAGARSESSSGGLSLDVSLLTARIEGCVRAWGLGAFSVSPCAGLDVGALRAESAGQRGLADTGVWSSAGAHARGSVQMGAGLALELQAGAFFPFVRYRLGSDGGREVFRSEPVGLRAALGFSWQP